MGLAKPHAETRQNTAFAECEKCFHPNGWNPHPTFHPLRANYFSRAKIDTLRLRVDSPQWVEHTMLEPTHVDMELSD